MYDPELMHASLINLIEKHKNRGQTQEQFEVSEDLSCPHNDVKAISCIKNFAYESSILLS